MKENLKAYKNVFERSTIKAIFDLIAKGIIKGMESPIKIGKESNIFSAIREIDGKDERVALKIYRISTCDFKRMKKYLILDPRYKVGNSRKTIILQWAKREFSNLTKCYKNNISVPKPIARKDNVIVMEFIGNKKVDEMPIPASLLKDKIPKNTKKFFLCLIEEIKKMYLNAKIIHGDLSEYNILNYNEKPIIIDLSHGLPAIGYREYLRRDIENIVRFFKKLNLDIDKEEIEKYITKEIE
ncbi:MAG: RIO1 family regulatory kinase/ATPase [Candidatus Pacearchaeota archaeon]